MKKGGNGLVHLSLPIKSTQHFVSLRWHVPEE